MLPGYPTVCFMIDVFYCKIYMSYFHNYIFDYIVALEVG